MKTIQFFKINLMIVFLFVLGFGCHKNVPVPSPQGIAGTITDKKTNKPISGAVVKLLSPNRNDTKTTANDGTFRYEGLEIGSYSLNVSAAGYKSDIRNNVSVSIGLMSPADFALELELPRIEIIPANLSFGANESSKTIFLKNVSNQGTITVDLKIPDDAKWISISKTSLSIDENQQDELTVVIDNKGRSFGSYSSGIILNYRTNYNSNSDVYQVSMIVPNPQAPSVTTGKPFGITQTSANITGTLTNTGGSFVTQRGICWSEGPNPHPDNDPKDAVGAGGIGSFTVTAKNLVAGKAYYVRAYAINSNGTGLGEVQIFTTSFIQTPPSLSMAIPLNINQNSATISGKVTNDGGSSVTEQGFCWNTTGNPKSTDNAIKVTSIDVNGNFSANMSGLKTGTVHYVKAYAINNVSTGYSPEISFTPVATLSSITTTNAGAITATSATSGGNITSDGGANITARGVCWDIKTNPTMALNTKTTDGIGTGSFSSALTGLASATTYYYRAYATNSIGTSYGVESSFITNTVLATLTTNAVTEITNISAVSGGNISSGGTSITARGICWSKTTNPTIALSTKTSNGTGAGSFTSSITGLTANTNYYVRSYATNSAGTAYGNEQSFTTPAPLAVGQSYGGGRIFYIDATGQHGLIAAATDQSTGIQWYKGKYIITGANDFEIGSGQGNTKKIIDVLEDGDYAANLCDKLVLNGFEDWFLPSKKELDLLYSSLNNRVGSLGEFTYWSSTENGDKDSYFGGAFVTSYYYFITYGRYPDTYRVRAVRAF